MYRHPTRSKVTRAPVTCTCASSVPPVSSLSAESGVSSESGVSAVSGMSLESAVSGVS